ncbi:OLC1v1030218C1 [Oldenlandia corymbosa var. corymbosa]|uniref:OLC1v1030218C1 n=1 Tax=Oldenlandia corymbosa var. corymbosa TaxID=529605 RepID=A0AAV1CIZ9_OLDCO|nr:OLC1v1030218C1 [Oldenlandia corymbosa var. corymbosa]
MAKEVVRVEDVQCLLNQDRLNDLENYYSLTAIHPILPESFERANTPPPGKITIYEKFLLVRCGKSFPGWFSFTKNPNGPPKELVAKNKSSKHWRSGFFYVDSNLVDLYSWKPDEGGKVSLDPWTKRDNKEMEARKADLGKLVGWKKTYKYRKIASLSNTISSRIFANLMGKCSTFNDSDEEEPFPEKSLQETPQCNRDNPILIKILFVGQAVQAIGSFVIVCTNLERQVALARKKASNKASKAMDAETRLQALGKEKRRLEEDLSTMKGQLEDVTAAHNLQIEGLRATTIPKSDLLGVIRDDEREDIRGKAAVQGGKHFRDMNFALLPIMQQITKACATVSKPEDIADILGSLSFVFKMPKGIQMPLGTPQGLDEEPEAVEVETPPKGNNSGSQGEGGTSTDSNTNNGDKLTRASCVQGKDAALNLPNPPEGTSQGVPAAPGKWETSGIPWIDLHLPDPHFDPTTFPLYAVVRGALVDPPSDRSRGRLSSLEGQLKEALEAYRASKLGEARRAIIEVKAENDRLDKLWRDTEAYWEGHMKYSIQLEMLSNNRLRKFEAKIRKKKKDDGLPKPDPENFIPRNYFESVLVHLWKAYALVAIRWDRSSDKIEALRGYADQLQAALESTILFIVETGKKYDIGALWPDPYPSMRDDPASPTREAKHLIYENDAPFHELGQGSH